MTEDIILFIMAIFFLISIIAIIICNIFIILKMIIMRKLKKYNLELEKEKAIYNQHIFSLLVSEYTNDKNTY